MDPRERIYNKYNFKLHGTLQEFKNATRNAEGVKKLYDKFGMSKDGTLQEFTNALLRSPSNIDDGGASNGNSAIESNINSMVGIGTVNPSTNTTSNITSPEAEIPQGVAAPTTRGYIEETSDYTSVPTAPVSKHSQGLDQNDIKDYIRTLESGNNYQAVNPDPKSSATGAFQVLWGGDYPHAPAIKRITGVQTREEFLNNPEAQEKYQDYLQELYARQLPKFRKLSLENGKDYSDKELMYIIHHSWLGRGARFIQGDTSIPDYKGLQNRIKFGRDQGLAGPRAGLDNSKQPISQADLKDITFVRVGDYLPTRGNKKFIAPVDINLVNKMKGVLSANSLVITDTNDARNKEGKMVHKDQRQLNGLSVDVNFEDRNSDPSNIVKAIQDGARQGLTMEFESPDAKTIRDLKQAYPELSRNFKHVLHASANHFSVYHDKNTIIQSSPLIEKSNPNVIRDLKKIQADVYQSVADLRPAVSAVEAQTSAWTNDLFGLVKSKVTGKGNKATEKQLYDKILNGKFADGTLNVDDYTDEELLFLFDEQKTVDDLKNRAEKGVKYLDKQLNDKGIFESIGDIHAGSPMDKLIGSFSGKADMRLDTDNGKINIRPFYNAKNTFTLGDGDPLYMSPDAILNLKSSPKATNPDDPNDPENVSLRRVQKILSTPRSLGFEAVTKPYDIRLRAATSRLDKMEKQVDTRLGVGTLEKYYEMRAQLSEIPNPTEEDMVPVKELEQQIGEIIDLNELMSINASRHKTYTQLTDIEGRFGELQKLDGMLKVDSKNADDIHRAAKWYSKGYTSIDRVIGNTINLLLRAPSDMTSYGGALFEGVTGLDIGSKTAINRKSDYKVTPTTTSKLNRSALEYEMQDIDGHNVVFDKDGVTGIYDKDGYSIHDAELFKSISLKAKKELKDKYNDNYRKLDKSFNGLAAWGGVEQFIPQLAAIYLSGNVFRAGGLALSSKIVARGARNGALANAVNAAASSGRVLSSLGTIPAFAGDFMDEAVQNGAITSGQLFAGGTVGLALEALAEGISLGPLGRALGIKGITPQAFKKSFMNKVKDSMRHLATDKITVQDIMRHTGVTLKTLGQDFLGEAFEEGIVEVLSPSTHAALNNVFGTSYDTDEADAATVLSSSLVGGAAGMIMGSANVVKSAINYRKDINETYKEELADVIARNASALTKNETVLSPELFKEYSQGLVDKGIVEQDYADKFYNAIHSASERTKFLDDIDSSSSFFNDNDIEAKEKFMNLARNMAFNKYIADTIDTKNKEESAEKAAKIERYENLLNELEVNSHAGLYTATTPSIIGTAFNLNKEDSDMLSRSAVPIIEIVNSTKFNLDNKIKYYNLLLQKEAIKIKATSEGATANQKARAAEKTEVINSVIEDIKEDDAKETSAQNVKEGRGTPEEVKKQKTLQEKAVDVWFEQFGDSANNADLIARLYEDNPLSWSYIDKKINDLGLNELKEKTRRYREAEESAQTTVEGFDARYEGNDELRDEENKFYSETFGNHLDKMMKELDKQDPEYNAKVAAIKQIKSDNFLNGVHGKKRFTSLDFKEKYETIPEFKAYVDSGTSQKDSPINYTAASPSVDVNEVQNQEAVEESTTKTNQADEQEASKDAVDAARKQQQEIDRLLKEREIAQKNLDDAIKGELNEVEKEIARLIEKGDINIECKLPKRKI